METEIYKKLSGVYTALSLERFSLSFGKAILSYAADNKVQVHSGLDLCCGTGELCQYFSEHGIRMTGVDLSPEMIEIARESAPGCRFQCADITDFQAEGTFDLVTCIDDSLNHLTEKDAVAKVFDTVYDLLPEDGLFFFDIINPDALTFDEPYRIHGKDGFTGEYFLQELPEGHDGARLLDIRLAAYENEKELFSVTSRERIYERNEIWAMLMDAGFTMPVCTTDFYGETTDLKYKIAAQKI